MKNYSNCFLVLALQVAVGAMAVPASAQESLELDLVKAIEISSGQSRKAKMRDDELEAAVYRRDQAFGRFLPKLTLSGRYSRVSHVEPGSVGTMQLGEAVDNQYSLRVAVDQPVFTGFALSSAYQITEYAEDIASQRGRLERSDVRALAQEAYFNLLKARQMRKDTAALVASLEEHLRQIQLLYDAGRATELDISRVGSRVASARVSVVQTEGAESSAQLALTTLLGIPSTTVLTLADVVDSAPGESRVVDELVASALTNRPEVAIAQQSALIAQERVKIEGAGLWPQVALRLGYNYDRPNQRYFPAQDEFNGTWDVSAMVSWTAWDWGTTYYGKKAAEAEARAATRNVEETQDLIRLDVERRRQGYTNAFAKIEAARELLNNAERSFHTAEILFEAGRAESLDLLDAATELSLARSELVQALADARIAWAYVQKSLGAE